MNKLALRKFEKEDSRVAAAVEVATSAPVAILFTHLAVFIVTGVKDLLSFSQGRSKGQDATKALVKKTQASALFLVKGVVFGTLGYVVGTLILPGRGTLFIGIIAESLAYVL